MKVYQIRLKLFTLQDLSLENTQAAIASFIDSALAKDKEMLELHEKNDFKNYCFDGLYPTEPNKLYKAGNIYTLTIRTIDAKLADYFNTYLKNHYDNNLKALTCEIRIIPKKIIEKVYSITPIVIKEQGYWKGKISLDKFEERIKVNLIKKYNEINNCKIDEDFNLYSVLEFKNKKPIATNYKNIKLLGDKISIQVSEDKMAQELIYMSLGTGLGEINSRGYGFVNFRYL